MGPRGPRGLGPSNFGIPGLSAPRWETEHGREGEAWGRRLVTRTCNNQPGRKGTKEGRTRHDEHERSCGPVSSKHACGARLAAARRAEQRLTLALIMANIGCTMYGGRSRPTTGDADWCALQSTVLLRSAAASGRARSKSLAAESAPADRGGCQGSARGASSPRRKRASYSTEPTEHPGSPPAARPPQSTRILPSAFPCSTDPRAQPQKTFSRGAAAAAAGASEHACDEQALRAD